MSSPATKEKEPLVEEEEEKNEDSDFQCTLQDEEQRQINEDMVPPPDFNLLSRDSMVVPDNLPEDAILDAHSSTPPPPAEDDDDDDDEEEEENDNPKRTRKQSPVKKEDKTESVDRKKGKSRLRSAVIDQKRANLASRSRPLPKKKPHPLKNRRFARQNQKSPNPVAARKVVLNRAARDIPLFPHGPKKVDRGMDALAWFHITGEYRSPPAGSDEAKKIATDWQEKERIPDKLAKAWTSKGVVAKNMDERVLFGQHSRDRNWVYKTWRETGLGNDELDKIVKAQLAADGVEMLGIVPNKATPQWRGSEASGRTKPACGLVEHREPAPPPKLSKSASSPSLSSSSSSSALQPNQRRFHFKRSVEEDFADYGKSLENREAELKRRREYLISEIRKNDEETQKLKEEKRKCAEIVAKNKEKDPLPRAQSPMRPPPAPFSPSSDPPLLPAPPAGASFQFAGPMPTPPIDFPRGPANYLPPQEFMRYQSLEADRYWRSWNAPPPPSSSLRPPFVVQFYPSVSAAAAAAAAAAAPPFRTATVTEPTRSITFPRMSANLDQEPWRHGNHQPPHYPR